MNERLWCIAESPDGFNARGLRLGDPLCDRPAEIEHLVEHLNADAGLGLLGSEAAGAQNVDR